MHQPSERKQDGVSGRFYREFRGVRHWYWEKRKLYCSQRNGRQSFLHRVLFEANDGRVPDRALDVVPRDGDWENFSPANWRLQRRGSERPRTQKYPAVRYRGVLYNPKPEGYFKARREHGGELLHRAVWLAERGPIPDGFHVHHINGNKADNRVENLAIMAAADHSKYHAPDNKWVGSEANKLQLRTAAKRAIEWHQSDAGREWHRQHGRTNWAKRKSVGATCQECGTGYETFYPSRSMFCSKNCKMRTAYRRKRVGV